MRKIGPRIQNITHLSNIFVICSNLSILFMQCSQMSTFQLIQMTKCIIQISMQMRQLSQTSLTTCLRTGSNQLQLMNTVICPVHMFELIPVKLSDTCKFR